MFMAPLKTRKLTRRTLLAGGVLAPALLPNFSRAQTRLPDKGLEFLVGFVANGGVDVVARAIAAPLERRTGRHITIQNRPGKAGAVPGEIVKRSAPDGTTLAFLSSTTLVSRLNQQDFPFDPMRDLTAISLAGTWPIGLAVSSKTDIRTFDEYLKWVWRDDPKHLVLGSTASDTFIDAFSMMVGKSLGVKFQPAAYRGAQPMVNDLSEGRLSAAVSATASLMEGHRSNRLRLLMTTSPKRLSAAPEVPTARELGYPGLEGLEWFAFFAPAKTPAPLITEWNSQIRAVFTEGELKARLTQLGMTSETSTPEEAAARVVDHLGLWKDRMFDVGMRTI
jgi:tripartite-type tricarboxylate transporter receptor subunit TctC